MSRCFPYPPSGYTPSRANKEAVIESIKLQKEHEKANAQKIKEKRREKDDVRKVRKDERNELMEETNEKTDLNSKKRRKRRKREEGREERKRRRKERNERPDQNSNKFDFRDGRIGNKIEANKDQLEGSGLTEEHDQPVRLHLPSTSSESTENSSKRMRPSSPAKVTRGHGNIIRIQLSKNQNLSDISKNELLCSASGRTDIPPLRNGQSNMCASTERTSDFFHGHFNRTFEKQINSTPGKSQPTTPSGIPPGLDAIEGSKKSSKSIQYKNLIENWVPPSLQDAPSSPEDLGWLICSKDQPQRIQSIENDGVFCSSGSSLLQPRAKLLPGIYVYALPFTVPY